VTAPVAPASESPREAPSVSEQETTSPVACSRAGKIALVALYALTGIAVFICARIEYLNVKSGGVLPRQTVFPDNPYRNPKWRTAVITDRNESRWRERLRPVDEQGDVLSRPLTRQEELKIDQRIERMRTEGRLKSFVASWGLKQYLLLPVLLIWSFTCVGASAIAAFNEKRLSRVSVAYLFPFLASVVCAAFAWHRSYFGSLGW
jgi:hypothetical protein